MTDNRQTFMEPELHSWGRVPLLLLCRLVFPGGMVFLFIIWPLFALQPDIQDLLTCTWAIRLAWTVYLCVGYWTLPTFSPPSIRIDVAEKEMWFRLRARGSTERPFKVMFLWSRIGRGILISVMLLFSLFAFVPNLGYVNYLIVAANLLIHLASTVPYYGVLTRKLESLPNYYDHKNYHELK